MNKLTKVLSYLQFMSLAAFMVLLGILAFSKNIVAGIFLVLLAAGTLFALFYKDKRSSNQKIIKTGDPLLNIVVDAVIIGFTIADWDNISGQGLQTYIYLTVEIALTIDLVLWIIHSIQNYRQSSIR